MIGKNDRKSIMKEIRKKRHHFGKVGEFRKIKNGSNIKEKQFSHANVLVN